MFPTFAVVIFRTATAMAADSIPSCRDAQRKLDHSGERDKRGSHSLDTRHFSTQQQQQRTYKIQQEKKNQSNQYISVLAADGSAEKLSRTDLCALERDTPKRRTRATLIEQQSVV